MCSCFISLCVVSYFAFFFYLYKLLAYFFLDQSNQKIACLSRKIDFVLSNSADPDEMPHYAAFHLCLHFLPN